MGIARRGVPELEPRAPSPASRPGVLAAPGAGAARPDRQPHPGLRVLLARAEGPGLPERVHGWRGGGGGADLASVPCGRLDRGRMEREKIALCLIFLLSAL